ncbi:hypothetical protein ABW19_dt0201183 [Dactylella cylindrospora]|nr:hypothetical protein ABW19_dt0201183 [Dactylella cylindrospora]
MSVHESSKAEGGLIDPEALSNLPKGSITKLKAKDYFQTVRYPREIPDLPGIEDESILSAVFTHPTMVGVPPASTAAGANLQPLEKLGDRVIGLCATIIVQKRYPHYSSHQVTTIESLLLSNANLARYGWAYNFGRRLRFPTSRLASVKDVADCFEAYVGGLFKDRKYEIKHIRRWLKKIFLPDLRALDGWLMSQAQEDETVFSQSEGEEGEGEAATKRRKAESSGDIGAVHAKRHKAEGEVEDGESEK